MGNIWHIYKTDWKNIFRVPTVLLLVVGLMFLPSAYAWFNIKSMWDPYGNTSGIQVAVVNEDEGAVVLEKPFNAGAETVNKLKKNRKLGWVFVNRSQAIKGVEHGDYYAYLIIPKNFSKELTSILEANPQKPEIIFGLNEKINAIAPKITSSGASSVMAQISDAFTETVGSAIFSAFNEAGVELQKEWPSIQNVASQILELEKALPQIEAMGNKAIELEGKLPDIQEKGQQIIQLEQRIPELDSAGNSILKVEASLPTVDEAGDRITELQTRLSNIASTSAVMNDVVASLTEVESQINQALDNIIAAEQTDTSVNQEQLKSLLNELVTIRQDIQDHRTNLQQQLDKVEGGINTAANFIKNDLPTIEDKIHKAADFVRNDLPKVEDNIREAADLIRTKLPEVVRVIHKAADLAKNDLPGFENEIRTAADKIRKFNQSVNIHDLIEFLMHDPGKESNFLSSPIQLKTKRIFPIPNYGSAMTPFYTMLALWVGGMLLISSMRVDVENPDKQYKNYQLYFGRLFTFLTIGVFQAIIVSLGDLYIIHSYVVDKLWFVLLSVFISIVFGIITYTLCSVFGNIGKGLSIILLVLQISSSGATFPVTVTSSFFQKLYPFMPFTYAVSMLRETVGGMIQEVVIKDVVYLLGFAGLSFLIALVLKKPLSPWLDRTAEKAKSTKLIP
ncbi:YhgE/Pip domain-containing protein [Neobacillus dielmonensis]|uniref:YhgE/Pip domain-containing protein n=1 Tax=Neobacillus dielmonensis TaxID=1347369 RepID=UPI0005A83B43|nr:YhgE/Pip domain-containing protein [Neobacillus dielmonensis]